MARQTEVTRRVRACHDHVRTRDVAALEALTPEELAWVEHSERLWQRAHAIAAADPEVDVGDVYHALP